MDQINHTITLFTGSQSVEVYWIACLCKLDQILYSEFNSF